MKRVIQILIAAAVPLALTSGFTATSSARAGPRVTPAQLAMEATSSPATPAVIAASTLTTTGRPGAGPVSDPGRTRPPGEPRPAPRPPAGALPPRPDSPTRAPRASGATHAWRMTLEALAVTGGGAIWYWSRADLQRQDWELGWDWPSWKYKLTDPGSLRFDTNGFNYNAIDHPLAGTADYQIARANGLGAGGATLFAFGAGLFWEYVVEFKELPSLNDVIINASAGLAVGEPLRQVGLVALSRPPGPVPFAVAAVTAPFDLVHGYLDGGATRPGRGAGPWYRLELSLGGLASWPGQRGGVATRRLEAAVGADVHVVRIPGFGDAGHARGSLGAGGDSRIIARLAYRAGADEPIDLGARFLTRTSLWGHYWRAIDRGPDGLRGQEGLVSLGTGFTYDTRQLADERDRLAAAHLAGVQLGLVVHRGPLRLSWETGVYGDFSMIQAHVFGPVLPFAGHDPPLSALSERGYYFGLGGTGETRVRVDRGLVRADAAVRAHVTRSLDGLDRTELSGDAPQDPHGLTDQRVVSHLDLSMGLGSWPLRAGLVGEVALRRGAWGDLSRTTTDANLGVELSVDP